MGIIYKISIYFLCIITNRIAIRHYFRYTERSCCTTHLHERRIFFEKKYSCRSVWWPYCCNQRQSLWYHKEAAAHSEQIGSVYGMINGIEGFLSGHIMDLSKELSDEDLELLRLTPAAYLGSCRYKLPEIWMLPFTPFFLKNLNS